MRTLPRRVLRRPRGVAGRIGRVCPRRLIVQAPECAAETSSCEPQRPDVRSKLESERREKFLRAPQLVVCERGIWRFGHWPAAACSDARRDAGTRGDAPPSVRTYARLDAPPRAPVPCTVTGIAARGRILARNSGRDVRTAPTEAAARRIERPIRRPPCALVQPLKLAFCCRRRLLHCASTSRVRPPLEICTSNQIRRFLEAIAGKQKEIATGTI
jgi:hypothetical protein